MVTLAPFRLKAKSTTARAVIWAELTGISSVPQYTHRGTDDIGRALQASALLHLVRIPGVDKPRAGKLKRQIADSFVLIFEEIKRLISSTPPPSERSHEIRAARTHQISDTMRTDMFFKRMI